MTRSQFLGVILAPVALFFRKKKDWPMGLPVAKGNSPILAMPEIKSFWYCEECKEKVPGGLANLADHMNKPEHSNVINYHGTPTQKEWDAMWKKFTT